MVEVKKDIETETYPTILVKCDDCPWNKSGQIGPVNITEPYPLVKYIWPNPFLNKLINHHLTNRKSSGGHNSFTATSNGETVGKLKVSQKIHQFVPANYKEVY